MGHENIVHALTHHGASPNTANVVRGSSPRCCMLKMADFLGRKQQSSLSPGVAACPHQRGETALHMAARAGQADVVRYLLKNGAKVETKSKVCSLKIECVKKNVNAVGLLNQCMRPI